MQRKDNTLLIERTRRCAQEARARYHATVEAKISRDLARFPWESVVNRVLQLGSATPRRDPALVVLGLLLDVLRRHVGFSSIWVHQTQYPKLRVCAENVHI